MEGFLSSNDDDDEVMVMADFVSPDVCGGLAPSLLSGHVSEAAVSSGQGTSTFPLPLLFPHPRGLPDHSPCSHMTFTCRLRGSSEGIWPHRGQLCSVQLPGLRPHACSNSFVCLLSAGM